MNKFRLFLLPAFALGLYSAQAQVKVGDNPTNVNSSAIFEMESTNKGVLFPRMALTAANSPSPLSAFVAGMTVYNTATAGSGVNVITPGLYYSDGTKWMPIGKDWAEDQSLGSIAVFPFASVPSTYLICNGQAVSRTTYAALYAKIGTTYGAGDGSTTFNLPDLRGEFIRGWDNGRGVDSGRALGSTQVQGTARPTTAFTGTTSTDGAHTHTFITMDNGGVNDGSVAQSSSSSPNSVGTTSSAGSHTHTVSITGGGDSETRPRNVAMVYAIKAVESIIVSGSSGSGTTYNGSTSVTLNGTSFERAALTGDVTATANSNATTIAANAVTTAKIADGTIITADVADGAITAAKINQMSATSGQVLKWNGTAWAPAADIDTNTAYTGSTSVALNGTSFERAALTGDVTATANSNATTIAANAVTSAKIADGTVATTDLADSAVTSAKIADGTIATVDMADSSVTSAKIADSTVANADLATGTGGIYKGSGSLSGNTTVTMATNTLGFTSTATTGTSHFTVDGTTFSVDAVNNRVGIGTGGPTAGLTLDVANITSKSFNLTRGGVEKLFFAPQLNSNDYSGLSTAGDIGVFFGNSTGGIVANGGGTSRGLIIAPWSANPSSGMKITEAGNVGVGTSNPWGKIHISGDSSSIFINSSFVSQNTGTGGHTWAFGARPLGTNGDFSFSDETDGQVRMIIQGGTGNVGIGTTTPVGKLAVIGPKSGFSVGTGANSDGPTLVAISAANTTLRYTDWPNSWGGGLSTWDVVGASAYFSQYITRSDARLKTDVQNINSSIFSNFMKIRPVTYFLKEKQPETEGLQYGFIAQEIRELFPSIVTKASDPAGTIGMNYQALISPTIYVVQQQQKQIEDLNKKIQELESKIEQLISKK